MITITHTGDKKGIFIDGPTGKITVVADSNHVLDSLRLPIAIMVEEALKNRLKQS